MEADAPRCRQLRAVRPARAPGRGCARTGSTSSGFAIAYMLIPIVVILVFSFNDPAGKYNFAWHGFTLDYWEHAFAIPELNDALLHSLKLAALATLLSTILGTLMAMALVRYDFFGRRAANFLIVLPMATPEIVMGASLLSMFLIYGLSLGFTSLLIAHVMFCISFVVVVVRSRLIGFDRSIEEAAAGPGRGPAHDLQERHAAAVCARNPCRGATRLRPLDRRLRRLQLQRGHRRDLPALHLRRGPARHPRGGQLRGDDPVRVTLMAMGFTVWQQRRAEQMASVRPEQEV